MVSLIVLTLLFTVSLSWVEIALSGFFFDNFVSPLSELFWLFPLPFGDRHSLFLSFVAFRFKSRAALRPSRAALSRFPVTLISELSVSLDSQVICVLSHHICNK